MKQQFDNSGLLQLLITLQIYHNLPLEHVVATKNDQLVSSASGPDEALNPISYKDVAWAQAISTYPHFPGRPTRVTATKYCI